MKSRYMNKDLGDGTRLGIIVTKHPVMDLKLPALQFKIEDKTLMCFLADSEGNSIVLELFEALGEYIADVEDAQLEAMEENERLFVEKMIENGKLGKAEATV